MPRRRDNTHSHQKLIIVIAAGIVVLIMGINGIHLAQKSSNDTYILELNEISNQSRLTTKNYENSIGEWKSDVMGDIEMLRITDNNIEQLQSLLSQLKSLEPPEKFKDGHEMNILSLKYELQSNKHMRVYVETHDQAEYEKSSELFQLAFDYETKAFALFIKANENT